MKDASEPEWMQLEFFALWGGNSFAQFLSEK
jgi:hypothetical protein